MTVKTQSLRFTKLLATSSLLAAGAVAVPISVDHSPESGVSVHLTEAYAKGGEGGESGGDRGGDSGGEGGNDSGGESGSSSGGESGSSSGGESGSSSGGESDSSSGGESGDDSGGERGSDSDSRDRDRSRDRRRDDSSDDRGRNGRRAESRERNRNPGVEIQGDNIEVTFADGTKQEIEFGRFEAKDRFGNTVVERAATATDRAALQAAAANFSSSYSGTIGSSSVTKQEQFGDNIEVTFADGTKQEIEFGRLEIKDQFGNTVVERPATAADRAALQAAAGTASYSYAGTIGTVGSGRIAKTETAGQNIEVTFTDGTRQEIEFGRLEVKDMFGSTIVERPATAQDFNRLSNGISVLQ